MNASRRLASTLFFLILSLIAGRTAFAQTVFFTLLDTDGHVTGTPGSSISYTQTDANLVFQLGEVANGGGPQYIFFIRMKDAAGAETGEFWRLAFGFRSPTPLPGVGTYQIQEQALFDVRATFYPAGNTCIGADGSFSVVSLVRSSPDPSVVRAGGPLSAFSATWVVRCGPETGITGSINFGTPGETGGDPTQTPPPPFQISLPGSLVNAPLTISNARSTSFLLNTVIDSYTFNSDLHLSVVSDAQEHEDFKVEVTPAMIPAPGAGEAAITVTTGPMTYPRIYTATVVASTDTQTTSSSFQVDVQCDPPFILGTDQPKTITAQNGTQVELAVTAGGTGPFTYQWFKGHPGMTGNPIAAAHESKLIFTTRATETYWVRVSNACGTVNSLPATVNTIGALSGSARRRGN